MADGLATAVALDRSFFAETERRILTHGELAASLFRYPTGVEAIRITNARGSVIVLPYMGQIVWRATFDGVELAMQSMFDQPRPARTIVETYGPLVYHAGILRNGVPGPGDDHALHGEMPCLPMDTAGLVCGRDETGEFISVTSKRDYAMGFGAHYLAEPSVTLRAREASIAVTMTARNLSAAPMDLMYLCHANFAFSAGARFVQPVPFDTTHVVTRTAVPGHIRPTEDYHALLGELAEDPARMERLREPGRYEPEQVCYVKGLRPEADGLVRFMLERPEGDGFTVAYDPTSMPHLIRWVLYNSDQQTAAFAMPATCEPEGYTAEKRKGHVRSLPGGQSVTFTTHLGYADPRAAAELAANIDNRARGG